MGRIFIVEFDQYARFYVCRYCDTHLALNRNFIAYMGPLDNQGNFTHHLFRQVNNVKIGEPILSNNYSIAEVHCVQCNNIVGRKYCGVPADKMWIRGTIALNRAQCFQWTGTQLLYTEIPTLNRNQMANPNPVQNQNPDADQDPNLNPDLEPEQELNPNEDADQDPNPNPNPDPDHP